MNPLMRSLLPALLLYSLLALGLLLALTPLWWMMAEYGHV